MWRNTHGLSWTLSYHLEHNCPWKTRLRQVTSHKRFCPEQSRFLRKSESLWPKHISLASQDLLPLTDSFIQLPCLLPMTERRRDMNCWLAAMKGPTSSLMERLASTRITLISTSSILLMASLVDSDSSSVVDILTASLPCREGHFVWTWWLVSWLKGQSLWEISQTTNLC